jgi:hypothetical protein
MRMAKLQFRALRESLALGAVLIYMLDSIFHRPAVGQSEEDLVSSCRLMQFPDDGSDLDSDDEENGPSPVKQGLYFIADITWPDSCEVFRLPVALEVDDTTIAKWYRQNGIDEVKLRLGIRGAIAGGDGPYTNNRVNNRSNQPLLVKRKRRAVNATDTRFQLDEDLVLLRLEPVFFDKIKIQLQIK